MEYDGCEHEFESYSSEMIDRNTLAIFYDCSFIADNLPCSISLNSVLSFKFRGLVLNL